MGTRALIYAYSRSFFRSERELRQRRDDGGHRGEGTLCLGGVSLECFR